MKTNCRSFQYNSNDSLCNAFTLSAHPTDLICQKLLYIFYRKDGKLLTCVTPFSSFK